MPEHEVDVRMGEQLAARVDGVRGVSRRPDPRSIDDLADEAQIDVGDHDAASGGAFSHGDCHVRLGAVLEVDGA